MNLQKAFEEAGFCCQSYTNKNCLGVLFDGTIGQLFAAVLHNLELFETYNAISRQKEFGFEAREKLEYTFRGMRTDKLGCDTIAYFPDVPYKPNPWDDMTESERSFRLHG